MQELKLIQRLKRIQTELNLLGADLEDRAPILEHESSTTTASLMDSGKLESRVHKSLQNSLKSEIDDIMRMKIELESRRRALLTAIADVQHRLSESKGQRQKPLHDTLLQLRSKQRLMKYEADACKSSQKKLLLACRSRYCRLQKLYKDIKGIDEKSAQLISFRWTRGTLNALSTSLNEGGGSAENRSESFDERQMDGEKLQLTALIEQLFNAAITSTTRGYWPNENVEFAQGI